MSSNDIVYKINNLDTIKNMSMVDFISHIMKLELREYQKRIIQNMENVSVNGINNQNKVPVLPLTQQGLTTTVLHFDELEFTSHNQGKVNKKDTNHYFKETKKI